MYHVYVNKYIYNNLSHGRCTERDISIVPEHSSGWDIYIADRLPNVMYVIGNFKKK